METNKLGVLTWLENNQEAKLNQYLKTAKIDLLENFDLDKKMIDRNQFAQAIKEQRKNNTETKMPWGEIEINNKKIKVDTTRFKKMGNKYEELNKENPSDYEEKAEELDKEFAEKILLAKGNLVSFDKTDTFKDNRTAEEEAKARYEILNKESAYKNKIDVIVRNNEQYAIIKRKPAELKKILEMVEKENIHSDIELINKFVQTSWSSEGIDENNLSSEKAKAKLEEIKEKESNKTRGTFSAMMTAQELGNFLTTIQKKEPISTIIEDAEIVEEDKEFEAGAREWFTGPQEKPEEENKPIETEKNIDINIDTLNINIFIQKLELLIINTENEDLRLELEILIGKMKEIQKNQGNIRVKNIFKKKDLNAIIFFLNIDVTKKEIRTEAFTTYIKTVINEMNNKNKIDTNSKNINNNNAEAKIIFNGTPGGINTTTWGTGNGNVIGIPVGGYTIPMNIPSLGGNININNENLVEVMTKIINNINNNNTNTNGGGNNINNNNNINNTISQGDLMKEMKDTLTIFMEKFFKETEKILIEKYDLNKEFIENSFKELKEHLSKEHKEIIEKIIEGNKELKEKLELIEKIQKEQSEKLDRIEKNQKETHEKIDSMRASIEAELRELKLLYEWLQKDMKIVLLEIRDLKQDSEIIKGKLSNLQEEIAKLLKQMEELQKKLEECCEGEKPFPPIPPEYPEEDNLELNAVISDMGTDVHRERVSLETEEELKDRYKGLARYNMPKRAYLFLSRWAKRKRMIKAKMKAMAGKAFSDTGDMTKDNTLNEKTGDASDRHELEEEKKLDKVEKANNVTLQNPLINNICKQYLNDTIKEDQFQKQFNAIVDADANIQAVLKWKKITHIGTNILEKLRQQRATTALTQVVDKEINLYLADNNQSHIDTINRLISDHIKYNQKNPNFMTYYEDFLNKTPGALNKLQNYLNHQKSVMQMQNTNVKMNIDILIKGKSAYQIDNKDRQKWLKYKIGNALDKLPRWVQAGWFIGLSVGTGLLTWGLGFGAVAAAAITTGVSASSVGGMNALKKRTHFTKEQNTHEKNVVTDYRNEQKKIAERQNNALNGKRYQWKTYKSKRQLALYDQTTQENIQISNSISDTITDLSSKIGGLDAKEENYMKKNLIQGRVRLKYYRENGHNFLASNEKEQIEKDMKRLEKSLVLWVNKLWKTLTDIETMQATDDLGNNLTYDTLKKDLSNSYDKSLIQFKRERRNLAIKYGVATAALSAGMSIGAQYVFGTGIFGGEKVPGVSPSELTTKTHDEFVLGKAELLDSWSRNNIYNTGAKVFWMHHIPDGSTITLDYGAGTNLVPVTPGNLTASMYNAKIQTVMQNINGLNLDSHNKFTIMRELIQQPWKDTWAWTNFTNDYLQGMRCAETIEQAAKAFADSGKTNLNFDLDFNSAVSPTTEKIANASFTLKTPWVPWSWSARGKFLQFPVFFNTFKDVKKKEKIETKKPEPKTEPIKPISKPIESAPEPIEPTAEPIKPTIQDKKNYFNNNEDEKGPGPVGGKEIQNEEWIDINPITGKGKSTEETSWYKGYWISTRKEKETADIRDFAPKYPVRFNEMSLDEMAEKVLSNQRISLYVDPNYMNDSREAKRLRDAGDKKGAIEEMKKIIQGERNYIKDELTKIDQGYIDEVYGAIEKTFEKYGAKELMKTLPAKENIHVVCKYEFDAYNPMSGKKWWKTVGVCYTDNGHIMINYDVIHMRKSNKQAIDALKDTLIHELIHDSWVNNYHHYYELKDKTKWLEEKSNIIKEFFKKRRTWLKMLRKNPHQEDQETLIYGTAMNEAVTQMLADEIGKDIMKSGYVGEWYPKEKEVIRLLQNKFAIPFETFAKAIINRTKNENENNSLRILNERMNGTKNERPEFLKLVMCIMDRESNEKKDFRADYTVTKALINGETVKVTSKMKERLHPSLLEKDGKTGKYIRSTSWEVLIKKSILQAYPNIIDTIA